MAERLKDFFDQTVVDSIARDLHAVHARLNVRAFVAECLRGLDGLELTARGWHVAEVMRRHLPESFAEVARILVASLGPELPEVDRGFGMAPFRYMPHVFLVARYGLDVADFEPAMAAQYELTKRFSAEASIRAYLVRHPQATYERLLEWVRDPSVHVRRLVSEGTRPRLPWAPRLPAFQRDPAPVLRLLELLKDDPAVYVRRSVANNLNDIGKDHPDLMAEVCRRWSGGAGPERRRLIEHALRSLVKQGHRGALAVIGVASRPRVRIGKVTLSARRVHLGSSLRFSFELRSASRRGQELLVDFAVHFVKADGTSRPKVFKLRRLVLPPAARVVLGGTMSFADLTTRKHYPGRHRIDALVNGVAFSLARFAVARDR